MIKMHKGIDVSTYQGVIDWNKVKAAGIEYAIIRAGYGRYIKQKDDCFDANVKGAKAAGVKIGAYWFGYATDTATAKKEADVFAEVIKGIDFELPVFYDYEYDSFRYAEDEGVEVDKALASDIVIAFLDRMKEKGYTVANYVNPDLIKHRFDSRINKYDSWVAHYKNNADTSKEYKIDGFNIIGWQYSSTGSVAGINGNVDMDVFYIEFPDKPQATVKPTTSNTTTSATYKAGQAVKLSNTPVYNTATTSSVASRKTGTYYLWSEDVVGKRIRITNTPERVGKAGQVTGWMNVSDIVATTSTEPVVRTYKVVRGDSLWSIAAKLLGKGSRFKEIKELNGLKNDTIYAGQVLKIPQD